MTHIHMLIAIDPFNIISTQSRNSNYFVQPKMESMVSEVDFVHNEIVDALDNLDNWMKPQKVHLFFFVCFISYKLEYELCITCTIMCCVIAY